MSDRHWTDGDWWGLGVILGLVSALLVLTLLVWIIR